MKSFEEILKESLVKDLLNKAGRKLKVKVTVGKPILKDAPKWAKYLGKTPRGEYHWLEKKSDVETPKTLKYFPDAGKTEFTGFSDRKEGEGWVKSLKDLKL